MTSKGREPSNVGRTCDNASVISASCQFSVAMSRKLLDEHGFTIGGVSKPKSKEDDRCEVSVGNRAAVQLCLRRSARQRQSSYGLLPPHPAQACSHIQSAGPRLQFFL